MPPPAEPGSARRSRWVPGSCSASSCIWTWTRFTRLGDGCGVRRVSPDTDVVLLPFVHDLRLKHWADHETPYTIAAHEQVAERYGCPLLNLSREVHDRIADGLPDGPHILRVRSAPFRLEGPDPARHFSHVEKANAYQSWKRQPVRSSRFPRLT
jgi:hypothetical protein